eukprot:3191078-Rhodomonas_salina.2
MSALIVGACARSTWTPSSKATPKRPPTAHTSQAIPRCFIRLEFLFHTRQSCGLIDMLLAGCHSLCTCQTLSLIHISEPTRPRLI